ncbi:unnamed protein product, partial [Lepidochelys olivacea]
MMWISQTAYKEETELEAVSYQLLEQVTILFSQDSNFSNSSLTHLNLLAGRGYHSFQPKQFQWLGKNNVGGCKEAFEWLISKIFVVRGLVEGRTYFPVHTYKENLDETDVSLSIETTTLYSIDIMVIQWTHQISDVLRQDSAQMILQGETSGPTETEFWQIRKENLFQ